ncbi:732_t:CDS:1, partial [Acaulospora colombiana]
YNDTIYTFHISTNDTTAPITLLGITSEKIVNASRSIPAEVPAFSQPNDSPEMISSVMPQANLSKARAQSKPTYIENIVVKTLIIRALLKNIMRSF